MVLPVTRKSIQKGSKVWGVGEEDERVGGDDESHLNLLNLKHSWYIQVEKSSRGLRYMDLG